MVDITVGLAFIAGLVSFISPCVLPLVPAYVGYMGGQVTTQVAATVGGGTVTTQRNRFTTLLHGLFFVLGFTFVFVAFGLLTTAGSLALRGTVIDMQTILARLGGIVIIIFGLHVMGLLPRFISWVLARTPQMNSGAGYALTVLVQLAVAALLAWTLVTTIPMVIGVGLYLIWLVLGGAFTRPGDFWQRTLNSFNTLLYTDTRHQMEARSDAGFVGSALMGVVFSAGWTPCIGPVYGAVLTMAANGGSLSQAGILLAVYSLGLGVPFLLTAVALDQMQGVLRRLQRHMRTIELVSGVLLLVIGVMILTGSLQQLSQLGANGDFAFNLEHCATELFSGHITTGEFGACMDEGINYIPAAEQAAAEQAAANQDVGLSAPAGEDAVQGVLGSLSPLSEQVDQMRPAEGLETGYRAPDFEALTVSGEPVALHDVQASVTVLNFWATWCGPCRVEMPDFEAAYAQYAGDGLVVLAVNRGESVASVAEFQDEFGVSFPLIMDQDERITTGLYQVVSMPSTYVLDEDGVIVAWHPGYMTADQLDAYVQAAFDANAVS